MSTAEDPFCLASHRKGLRRQELIFSTRHIWKMAPTSLPRTSEARRGCRRSMCGCLRITDRFPDNRSGPYTGVCSNKHMLRRPRAASLKRVEPRACAALHVRGALWQDAGRGTNADDNVDDDRILSPQWNNHFRMSNTCTGSLWPRT